MANHHYASRHGGQPGIPAPRPVTYFTHDTIINPELVDSKAEAIARELADVKATQLRRYYEDVQNLRQRIKNEAARPGQDGNAVFKTYSADFRMLKAKAVYANGRSDKTFPLALLRFFIDHVNAVKTFDDFDVFYRHFQAVVAFHKFYAKKTE